MTATTNYFDPPKPGMLYRINGRQCRITKPTAQKRGYAKVVLRVHDWSGKGRGEERIFYGHDFENMRGHY